MSKARHPQITIAQETVDHLEALVEGASARMPALAERLLEELSRARILPAARMPADVVGIGSRVTWRDESTGQEQSATLVWPEAADIDAGRVSILSHVGAGLIGLKEGESINWPDPSGETRKLTAVLIEDEDPIEAVAH